MFVKNSLVVFCMCCAVLCCAVWCRKWTQWRYRSHQSSRPTAIHLPLQREELMSWVYVWQISTEQSSYVLLNALQSLISDTAKIIDLKNKRSQLWPTSGPELTRRPHRNGEKQVEVWLVRVTKCVNSHTDCECICSKNLWRSSWTETIREVLIQLYQFLFMFSIKVLCRVWDITKSCGLPHFLAKFQSNLSDHLYSQEEEQSIQWIYQSVIT